MTVNSSQTVLELAGVSLSFKSSPALFNHGTHVVLEDVSLSLHRGETLGIIGKNGCGKTSILRLMAGIIAPIAGKVSRHPDTSAALLTLGLGFKPQLTGRDNAILAAMLQGSSLQEARACLDDIKDFSELGDSFEEPVKTYSSGMRARLGFTTALMTHVGIMLIDEVLSVGDAQFKEKAETALRKRIEGSQTVVFVSHSPEHIRSLCDRAIWLDDGRIAQEGAVNDVLAAYNDKYRLGRQGKVKPRGPAENAESKT